MNHLSARKKQTQFKPNQSQFPKSPNERKLNFKKGLQKKRCFRSPNKQTQFLQRPKMNVNVYATKDYKNETAFRPQKNKPNQSQFHIPPKAGQIIQMSISPLPGVLRRESSTEADKIALKIYPFGIDCPIVLKELKLTDSLCHSCESGNPVKSVDSVPSTEWQ